MGLKFFDDELAIAIGTYEAIVLNKIQWCVESPSMTGTVVDGQKWIRNPIKCTDSKKLEQAKKHGKLIDWVSNFPSLKPNRVKTVFAKLQELGLVISRQFRVGHWDRCKYYTIDYGKLAELVEPALLSIGGNSTNRFDDTEHIDLTTIRKSYQDTSSKKVYQREPLTEEAGGTILVSLKIEEEDQEVDQSNLNFQSVKEPDSTAEPITLKVEKYSAPSSSVKRQEFYEALLAYCYQRVDINSPEGYATSVMRECRSRVPEASAAMLWAEFNAGEELGSRMVPPGFRLRGVPEQVVVEAISQDYMGKVGTTATEAARSAASQLRRLPVVAAVANVLKVQLERCIESATRQVELGIPKEQALLNNLPTYAVACNENLTPQIAATAEVEKIETLDLTDPYALTEGNLAARNKAFEAIKAVKAIGGKLPRRLTKREQILAANIADLADSTPFRKSVVVQPKPVVEDEDDSIPW